MLSMITTTSVTELMCNECIGLILSRLASKSMRLLLQIKILTAVEFVTTWERELCWVSWKKKKSSEPVKVHFYLPTWWYDHLPKSANKTWIICIDGAGAEIKS